MRELFFISGDRVAASLEEAVDAEEEWGKLFCPRRAVPFVGPVESMCAGNLKVHFVGCDAV